MNEYILDTDLFSHALRRNPRMLTAVEQHDPTLLAITIITVEELWDGWMAIIRRSRNPDDTGAGYDQLTTTIRDLAPWNVCSYTSTSVHRFQTLKRMRLNVGSNDLRIAAIALERGAIVVTRNTADFGRIPGLTYENWL